MKPLPLADGLILIPISLCGGAKMSEGLTKTLKEYAEWMRVQDNNDNIKVPETQEDFDKIHPLTKFRAACWKAFGNALTADALVGILNDCGLDIVVLAKEERKPQILTP